MKTRTQHPTTMKTTTNKYLLLFLSLVLALGMSMTGCEAPAGSDGSQGLQGPAGEQGPIGPAGEDGSVMHAGEGAPADDMGATGDFYLDMSTSELYGPKTDNGWGTSIALKGEDGEDGQDGTDGADGQAGADGNDGQDGADGEDGSQIFSGTVAPGSSLGSPGDFYLNTTSFALYGPKTSSGWGTPINLKGADGNANVTLYISDGHDFRTALTVRRIIENITQAEMQESAWQVYLGVSASTFISIPGIDAVAETEYGVEYMWHNSNTARFYITKIDGPAVTYSEIRIIRTEASNVVDNRSKAVPTNLDFSDYHSVVKYYGINENNTVRISKQ